MTWLGSSVGDIVNRLKVMEQTGVSSQKCLSR
jgi:hypothetical protein